MLFRSPEDVLLKAKKLPPVLYERVVARFDLIRRTLELEGCDGSSGVRGNGDLGAALEELEEMRRTVFSANEPTIVDHEPSSSLADIAGRRFRGPDGGDTPYLTNEELGFLELRRGTLNDKERAQAEYHAEATLRLLESVMWTDELKAVPNYASGHHEKLDGSGYPRGLRAQDIPLQTRIVGLCDMFDALTEADRPYKHSLPPAKAFDLLREEANAGRIDGELLRIMIETSSIA